MNDVLIYHIQNTIASSSMVCRIVVTKKRYLGEEGTWRGGGCVCGWWGGGGVVRVRHPEKGWGCYEDGGFLRL